MLRNTSATGNAYVFSKENVSCGIDDNSNRRVYRDFDFSTINDLEVCEISSSITDCKMIPRSIDETEDKPRTDLVALVYSSDSGEIISGASVYVFNSGYSFCGSTDNNGLIVFSDIPVDCYVVCAESGDELITIDNLEIYANVGKNYINLGLTDKDECIDYNGYSECHDTYVIYSQERCLDRLLIYPTYPCPEVNVSCNNSIYSIDMKTYVYHVVASELNSGTYFDALTTQQKITALEALSVAVRGFTFYQLGGFSSGMPHNGEYMCDSPGCCQSFNPNYTNEYTITAVDNCNGVIPVDSTTYQPFWAKYFSICDGSTHSSTDCPNNLISVACILHQPHDPWPGHSMVGMCQAGMCKMAQDGYTYSEILNYYYSNMILWVYLDSNQLAIIPGESKYNDTTYCYRFYVPSSSTYFFNLWNYYSNGVSLYLYNDDDYEFEDEVNNQSNASFSAYLNAGMYYLEVDSDYVELFNLSQTPEAVKGNGSGLRNYIYNCSAKIFKFTPSETGYYTIDTEPWIDEDVDTILQILSLTGAVLFESDDISWTNLYSHLYIQLNAGVPYYIKVKDYNEENISCRLFLYKGVYVS
jgi:hypothetical protein